MIHTNFKRPWHRARWQDVPGTEGYGYVEQTCLRCGRIRTWWFF